MIIVTSILAFVVGNIAQIVYRKIPTNKSTALLTAPVGIVAVQKLTAKEKCQQQIRDAVYLLDKKSKINAHYAAQWGATYPMSAFTRRQAALATPSNSLAENQFDFLKHSLEIAYFAKKENTEVLYKEVPADVIKECCEWEQLVLEDIESKVEDDWAKIEKLSKKKFWQR